MNVIFRKLKKLKKHEFNGYTSLFARKLIQFAWTWNTLALNLKKSCWKLMVTLAGKHLSWNIFPKTGKCTLISSSVFVIVFCPKSSCLAHFFYEVKTWRNRVILLCMPLKMERKALSATKPLRICLQNAKVHH